MRSNQQLIAFRDALNSHNLKDIGFKGPKLTCKHGHINTNRVEQLDRVVANIQWTSYFPRSILWHIPFLKSDHHPILWNINHSCSNFKSRSFKHFEKWWCPLFGYLDQIQLYSRTSNSAIHHGDWNIASSSFLKKKCIHGLKNKKNPHSMVGRISDIWQPLEFIVDDISSNANLQLQQSLDDMLLQN